MKSGRLARLGLALTLTAAIVIGGCSGARKAPAGSKAPGENTGMQQTNPQPAKSGQTGGGNGGSSGAAAPTGSSIAGVTEITQGQAPAELEAWATGQQMNESPAFTVLAHGEDTYVGVAGGVKRSGGYRIALKRSGVTTGDGGTRVEIDVAVIPPSPGALTTAVMANPMAFFSIAGSVPVTVHFVNP